MERVALSLVKKTIAALSPVKLPLQIPVDGGAIQ
jgi:hypothetical protein